MRNDTITIQTKNPNDPDGTVCALVVDSDQEAIQRWCLTGKDAMILMQALMACLSGTAPTVNEVEVTVF
jgi:hypothetical protein